MVLNPHAPAYIPQEVRNFNSMMRNVNAYGNNMMREANNAASFNSMMRNVNAYGNNMMHENENAAINEAIQIANENAAIAEAVAIQNASASSRRRKGRKASRKSRKSRRYNAMGGGVDNMLLQMPKVGYTQLPSDSMGGNAGVLADGKTPFMLNIPYSTSPSSAAACMKGGKRKASRKSRKSHKKSKKHSRKHRTRKH